MPTRPQEQKVTAAERAEYVQELKAYISARFEITKDFNASIKKAIEARRIAREAANSQEDRETIRDVFATSMETAKRIKAAALTALGDPPVKPTK